VYWCVLGPPAKTFCRGLGSVTLQPISSRAAGFPTNSRLTLWESAVAKVLNRQFASAATKQQCNAQAAAVSSVAAIYACGNSTRAGCSRDTSRYSARRRRVARTVGDTRPGGQQLCAGPLWISDPQAASGCSASLQRA